MDEQALSVRDAIISRRSIKSFNGQPIEQSDIADILEDAIWAPNHGNRNPWRFVLAAEENYQQFLNVLRDFAIPKWKELDDETLTRQMSKFTKASAALFVIVPEDPRQKQRLEDFAAASSLIQNIQLLTWDKGMGTCWKTPGFIEDPKFRAVLNVKPGERIISMLQFGHFDEMPKAKARKPVEELVTYWQEEPTE